MTARTAKMRHGLPCKACNRLKMPIARVYRSLATVLNSLEILLPTSETAPIITTAIKAAISAYSIAVTARRAAKNRTKTERGCAIKVPKLPILNLPAAKPYVIEIIAFP